jgi:hypothetical protein
VAASERMAIIIASRLEHKLHICVSQQRNSPLRSMQSGLSVGTGFSGKDALYVDSATLGKFVESWFAGSYFRLRSIPAASWG